MSSAPGKPWSTLADLGWDDDFAREFAEHFAERDCTAGRVGVRYKGQYAVLTEAGEVEARIKGVLRYRAGDWAELPVVGDWVALTKKGHDRFWRIHGVLARRTELKRKVAGLRSSTQVLAANVTVVVIVMALTEDYNIRRLERYLTLVHESGARPIVVLNKADLVDEDMLVASLREVRAISGDAEIVIASATEGPGIDVVREFVGPRDTVVFVGSSGVGKSTIVNAIVGEERMATGEVRETDGRGRHTTTRRELIVLPAGGMLIDSPGIREIQLVEADEGLANAFADIEELATRCRFGDCTHTVEPGCAIIAAIENDEIEAGRVDNWRALGEETRRIGQRKNEWNDAERRVFREFRARKKKRS